MNENQIVIYQTDDGQTQIDVRLENDTVWLIQAQMADLFQTDRTSIVRHVNNIYKVEELDKKSTCAKKAQVQIEGKRTVKRIVPFYNLDMIISVGYRVNSKRGVKFRQWANHVLKDDLFKERVTLTLSADGKTLSGVYHKNAKYALKRTK